MRRSQKHNESGPENLSMLPWNLPIGNLRLATHLLVLSCLERSLRLCWCLLELAESCCFLPSEVGIWPGLRVDWPAL